METILLPHIGLLYISVPLFGCFHTCVCKEKDNLKRSHSRLKLASLVTQGSLRQQCLALATPQSELQAQFVALLPTEAMALSPNALRAAQMPERPRRTCHELQQLIQLMQGMPSPRRQLWRWLLAIAAACTMSITNTQYPSPAATHAEARPHAQLAVVVKQLHQFTWHLAATEECRLTGCSRDCKPKHGHVSRP